MASYKEQLRARIWQAYREERGTDPVDLKDVARWAISKGLWEPRPIDIEASLANDLADALREEARVDKKGRRYRANIPVRKGKTLWEWADIDDAPHVHVEISVQQERRSIASDCYALAMKLEHYNDANPDRPDIQMVWDFEDDIEEAKIANGLGDEDDDEAA